jgi:hypothetical protein
VLCVVLLSVCSEQISAQVISTNGSIHITNTAGTVIVADSVDNASGSTFTNDGTLTTTDLANAGTLLGNGTYEISGAFSNISVFTAGTSTIVFNGISGQSLSAFTFGNFTLNNASGLSLSGNMTVNGTLTFSSGNITTGASKVLIGGSGSISRTSGHVVGTLEMTIPTGSPAPTFHIGDASYYTPIDLSFASVTSLGTITATTTSTDHPDIANSNIVASLSANRYWTLTNNGTVFTTADATFTFDAADVDGGATPTSFIAAQNSGSWSLPTVGTVTATSTQATGLTAFGDFLVGESALSANVTLASGGSAVSADNFGTGSWTTLTGPVYSEGASGNVQNGTIILNAPSGFEFDEFNAGGTAPTVLITRTAGGGAISRNINNVAGGTSLAITSISAAQIVFTVTDFTTNGVTNSLTWQNVRIRPTAGAPLATGQITKTGTSTMAGVTNGSTNFGTLTEVAGVLNKLQVIVPGETADASAPSGKTGTPTTQAVGGQFTFTVNSVDQYWNPVTATNTIQITSSDGGATLPSNAALVGGTADFDITLNTIPSQTITATSVAGPAVTSSTSSSIPVVAITLTPASGAGAVSADNFGTGTWTNLTGPVYGEANVGNVGTGTIILNAPSGFIFDAGGVAPTVLITGSGTAADNINNVTSGTSAAVTSVTATQITFTVTDASANATPNTLTWQNVRIRPSAGAPLASGNITKSGTAAVLGVSGSTNFGTLTEVAGTMTKLIVTLPGETFVAGSGNSGTVTGQTAGTPFNLVSLTAGDQYFNTVTSYSGTKSIAYAGPSGTASSYTTSVDFTAGVSTTTLSTTLTRAEATTITATDGGSFGEASSSLTVNAGTVTKLQILAPGESADAGSAAGKTGTPSAQTAGNSFNVTVHAVDANWNIVSSVTDVVGITSSDVYATLPANAALVTGTKIFAVTLKTAGTATVTASDITTPARTAHTTPSITVNAGALNKLQVLVPGETADPGSPTGKTGTADNAGVGIPFDITVNAVDANWNPVTATNTITITSTDGAATLPADADLVGGTNVFSISLNTAGAWTVTATSIAGPAVTAGTSASVTTAAVSITPATGGGAISADDSTSGAWTSLTGPVYGEAASGNVGTGTIILDAPSGFMFDVGGTAPTVIVTRTSGGGGNARNINSVASGTAVAITSITTTQITFTVTNASNSGVTNSLTWQNIRVRPTVSYPLVSGNITKSGTSTMLGVTNGSTNFGTLTEVLGAAKTWSGFGDGFSWNDAANWNPAGVPTGANNVTISANTITINSTASAQDLTINNASANVTISSGNALYVMNNYSQSNGTLVTAAAFPTVIGTTSISGGTVNFSSTGSQSIPALTYNNLTVSGSGITTLLGSVVINGDLSVSGGTLDLASYSADRSVSGGTLSIAASSTLRIGGTGTVPANYASHVFDPTGTIEFYGTAHTIPAGSYPNLTASNSGGTVTLGGNIVIAGDLTISGGTFDLTSYTANRSAPGGTLTIASLCTLRIGGTGTSLPTNYTTHAFDPASHIDYYGTGQTIPSGTYDNLVVSGSGTTITLSANVNVVGNLTVTDGTLDLSTFTADRTTVGGTLSVGAGGTLRIGGTNGMPADYSSYSFDPASTVEYYGTSQPIAAANYGNLTVSSSGTLTLASGTIGVAGTFSPVSGSYVVTGNTINFNGTGAQTIPVFNYNSIIISGNRGGATITLPAGVIGVAGTMSVTATSAVYSLTGNTVDYNGTSPQTIESFTYEALTLSNSGAKTIGSAVTVNTDLLNSAGASLNVGAAGILNITGDLINEGVITNDGSITIN